eukprot:4250183-Pyramimonas_sp.AAC.1
MPICFLTAMPTPADNPPCSVTTDGLRANCQPWAFMVSSRAFWASSSVATSCRKTTDDSASATRNS